MLNFFQSYTKLHTARDQQSRSPFCARYRTIYSVALVPLSLSLSLSFACIDRSFLLADIISCVAPSLTIYQLLFHRPHTQATHLTHQNVCVFICVSLWVVYVWGRRIYRFALRDIAASLKLEKTFMMPGR